MCTFFFCALIYQPIRLTQRIVLKYFKSHPSCQWQKLLNHCNSQHCNCQVLLSSLWQNLFPYTSISQAYPSLKMIHFLTSPVKYEERHASGKGRNNFFLFYYNFIFKLFQLFYANIFLVKLSAYELVHTSKQRDIASKIFMFSFKEKTFFKKLSLPRYLKWQNPLIRNNKIELNKLNIS